MPARPTVHDGEVFAAWLPQGEQGGVLWSSRTGQSALDYGGLALPDQRRPTFVASDDAVILNETRSGWVWTIPDGALVASSQDWSLDERTDPDAAPSQEQLSVVIDPKPPVAVADAFGVRAGSLVTLPALMNDHDPNEDVLSIDPASVTGLDPGFGTVSITDDSQRLTVSVAPGASGSTTFSYAVTDGTAENGLLSPPTTVTLTVSGGDGPRSGAASRDASCRGRRPKSLAAAPSPCLCCRAGSTPTAIRSCCCRCRTPRVSAAWRRLREAMSSTSTVTTAKAARS